MGDLGDGTGSSYPAALDTDTNQEVNSPSASKTKARAEVPNDLASAIIAVQTELGTDPAGTVTDVKTYLQTEHETDGTHGTVTGTLTPDVLTLAGSTWPSFSVNRNGVLQTIGTGAYTKVEWTTELFDTNSDFDSTTNYRFTPTVAGKYLLSSTLQIANIGAGNVLSGAIYKNGAIVNESIIIFHDNTANSITTTSILDANGSTDYFEIFLLHTKGADGDLDGAVQKSYFSGSRIA